MATDGSSNIPTALADASAASGEPVQKALQFTLHTPEAKPDSKKHKREEPSPSAADATTAASPGAFGSRGEYVTRFTQNARTADGAPLWTAPRAQAEAVEMSIWAEFKKMRTALVQEFQFLHKVILDVKGDADVGPAPRLLKDLNKLRAEYETTRDQLNLPNSYAHIVEVLVTPMLEK